MKKKIQQSSSLSLFDWIKQIINLKKDWSTFSEEDKKTYNIFMINKFISMNQDYLDIVNYVQKLNIQDKEKSYIVYCQYKNHILYIRTLANIEPSEISTFRKY